MGVNNADIGTLECALLERMYYCSVNGQFVEPPPVVKGLYTSRLSLFSSSLHRLVGHAAPISTQEVVDMYWGRKKTIYSNAKLTLER